MKGLPSRIAAWGRFPASPLDSVLAVAGAHEQALLVLAALHAMAYVEYVVRLFWSMSLFSLALLASFADLDGIWAGTFNGQPQKLLPDGRYPETITRFELILKTQGTRVVGTFTNLDEVPLKSQPIQNGKRIGDRFCFDVFTTGEDCRWCVRAHGSDLEGTWNRGPEGGPATGGLGAGVRLFQVRARRVLRSSGDQGSGR